jgi:regulator of cell morphogenesis and NO signaling
MSSYLCAIIFLGKETMDTSRHEFGEWPVDLLIDYALKVHHRGIREKGPRLLQLIRLLMDENMVMAEIEQLFSQSLENLENHLRKEENVLFPYLYDLLEASRNGEHIEAMHCGTIANPIRVMVMEHEDEKERHQRIGDLTNGYSAPADASEDYKLLVAGLKDFAADLHEHTHIENDIIFPYCQRIEEKIVESCIS